MKSRGEIVIIMLQWLRRYTLGSRGSRELKTFLETRLISSRVDQKLKNKEGKYMLLKREIGPTIVGHWSGFGGGLMASRGRFLGHGSWLQFRNKSASISPPNILHFSRDRATIGPRLGHDRATIGPRS